MAVQFLGVGALLTAITGILVWLGQTALTWLKEEALKIARNAAALVVWCASHLAIRLALAAAFIAASEVLLEALTRSYITPLVSSIFSRLLPINDGDFFYYAFWDSGLNAKEIVTQVILYLVRYTQMWALFDVWLRSVHIALGVYRAGLRRQEAVLQSSLR